MDLVVVYSSDDNYAQHTGVSIISLFENNKHFKEIDIYIIENKVSESNKIKFDNIAKQYNRKIYYIDFTKYKKILKLDMQWDISISSYARLFISSMLPNNIDKAFYFDCDTVIVNKLDELWNTNINNYYVAGVGDTVSTLTKEAVGINKKDNYINAGMLLINLKKWRQDNIQEKFIKFIDSYKGRVTHHDQGVINGVLSNKSKIVSPKFNLMTVYYTMTREDAIKYYGIDGEFYSEKEIDQAVKNPVYIHYTPGFTTRPWVKGCKHPKKELYFKYLNKSPWNSYKCIRDNSKLKVKMVNWVYRNLPFTIANGINKGVSKIIMRG